METNVHPRREPDDIPIDELSALARAHLVGSIDDLLSRFVGGSRPRGRPKKGAATNAELDASFERLKNVAEALMTWHSSDDFLTEDGSPAALPRTGPRSLASLARKVTTQRRALEYLTRDLERLIADKSLPESFAPAGRSAIFRQSDSLSLAYSTVAISRLIGTISTNYSGALQARFQRQVSDVNIRASDVPMFLRFVEQQGQYLIDAVDDWLAQRKTRPGEKADPVSVGLGAFAWADDSRSRCRPKGASRASRARR
jgi:hypothetical protein